MSMHNWICVVGLGLSVVACSGPQAHDEHAGHHEEGHEGKGHADLTGPLKDFHDVLAPVWHSKPGEERNAKACAEAGALKDKASAAEAAPTPEAAAQDEAGWKELTKATVAAANDLVEECKKDDKSGVEAKLTVFHEDFHKLVDRAGSKH